MDIDKETFLKRIKENTRIAELEIENKYRDDLMKRVELIPQSVKDDLINRIKKESNNGHYSFIYATKQDKEVIIHYLKDLGFEASLKKAHVYNFNEKPIKSKSFEVFVSWYEFNLNDDDINEEDVNIEDVIINFVLAIILALVLITPLLLINLWI